MPRYRLTILTNEVTGERYEFKSNRDANEWLGKGKNYLNDCEFYGYQITRRGSKDTYSVEKLWPEEIEHNTGKPATLQPCWFCKKALGGCSWSRSGEPVKGWIATPTVISKPPTTVHSYRIDKCPEYEKE